jgi:hypothetical protein
MESGVRRKNRIEEFFHIEEDDIQQTQCDTDDNANRVHGFDDHVSAMVPWLRETGIADHIRNLRKDEIRTAIAVPPPQRQEQSPYDH